MSLLSECTSPQFKETPSLWQGFQATVDSHPNSLAIACAHQSADLFGVSSLALDNDNYRQHPYLRWTYRDVHEAVHRLITAWRDLGVKEGSLLVTFAQNGVEWVLAAWAAIKMGCKIMSISPRNLTNEVEVRHMLATGLLASGSGHKQVVLAGTSELAKIIDNLNLLPNALRIVAGEGAETSDGTWMQFKDLLIYKQQDITDALEMPASNEGGVIMFTSGTTSLPKGVYMSFERNLSRVFPEMSQYNQGDLGPGAVMCHVMPNNHAMGWAVLMACLMTGAALAIPGQAFEPVSMLETLYRERATHTSINPTMIYALVAAKSSTTQYAQQALSHLEDVILAGSGVTPEHLRLVTEELGATGVENIYGCTEGLFVGSGCVSASETTSIVDGQDVSVGWPAPGYRMKVVNPETGETVPRNALGEIHGYGWCMGEPYIGGVGQDAWYSDEKGQRWYKTGDQGRMDEQGRLFIMGRYKDMIIRGGENISPSAIEAVLSKHVRLSPLLPQIVGAQDSIAGEVPVAVVKGKVTAEIKDLVQREIIHHMGALYVPEDVISIEDLGLEDFPRTTSGKIQKTKIRSLVDEYLSKPATKDADITQEIKTIWAKAVGLDPSHLRLDTSIGEFADSITIMRVREKIRKQTGKVLSLAVMAEAGTIGEQIKLLQSMEAPSKETQNVRVDRIKRQGGPKVEDMAHLTEDADLFGPTKELIVDTISRFGFFWEDVEDIMPAYDFVAMMTKTKLFESWAWEFALQPAALLDKKQIRRALEAVIINHRLLASFVVWQTDTQETNDALHIVMKQSTKFFDLIFEDGGELETLDDLKKIPEGHLDPNLVRPPGPLYRVILYDIKETGGAALAVAAHHAIMDASMMQLVHEDMDRAFALTSGHDTAEAIVSKLPAHVDYKVWADSYFNLRTSSEARAATKWHVKRLRSIAEHVKAGKLLPARSRTWTSLIPNLFRFDVPGIHKLRKEHPKITPTVLVKAAVALMDVDRTGYTHAVFGNLEAARTNFPFLSKSMLEHVSGHLLEGMDVSGPAFQIVFNVVAIDRSAKETVLGFLERMQDDQTALTKYASAPLLEIIKELDKISPGSGELVPQLNYTPHFNWVPGLGQTGTDTFANLKMLNSVSKPTTGMMVHAGLGGEKNQTVFMNVYGAGTYDRDEAARIGEKIVAITKWLATSENWNSPVVEYSNSWRDL